MLAGQPDWVDENEVEKECKSLRLDTSGIEPDPSRKPVMLSERDNQLHHVPLIFRTLIQPSECPRCPGVGLLK